MYSKFFNRKKNTFIIAEIGVNHNGSVAICKKLIKFAKKFGADAVKIQSFKASKLSTKKTALTNYQKKNLKVKQSHYEMLKKLELSEQNQKELFLFSKKIGIEFISTPFDVNSAKFLNKLGVKLFKVASPDLQDVYLHKYLNQINKRVIISTGMSNEKEIDECLKYYKNKKKIALLHCVSSYPASYKSINMRSLNILKNKVDVIGFSDHTLDNLSSLIAVSMGAKIIEKHFTLDKKMKGPDHRISLNPKEMERFINQIRKTEIILGEEIKVCQLEEKANKKIVTKNIITKKNIKSGTKVKITDLELLRAGNGLTGFELKNIVNKISNRDIKSGTIIKKNYFR